MTIISPSLLSCNFLNMEKEIKSFSNEKDMWFHCDIMDGHFVPNLTFGHPIIKKICSISMHPVDVHLMVFNLDFFIDSFDKYKIHNLTFHYEASADIEQTVDKCKKYYPNVGISIKPNTPANVLSDTILKKINLVLIMSVEPGFGGQTFMENSYDKISFLKRKKLELGLNFEIQVDGGINHENSSKLISVGATNLVAGTYIFSSTNYHQQINLLRNVHE